MTPLDATRVYRTILQRTNFVYLNYASPQLRRNYGQPILTAVLADYYTINITPCYIPRLRHLLLIGLCFPFIAKPFENRSPALGTD